MSINDEKENANQARLVSEFHKYSDLDSAIDSQHHTLGSSALQAAPGDHTHNGSNSSYLFNGVKLTGSISNGTALKSLISILTQLGLEDETDA